MSINTVTTRIRVCDRCGDSRDVSLPPPKSDEAILMRFEEEEHGCVDTTKDYNATRIDLCDSCTTLFVDWMRARGLFK